VTINGKIEVQDAFKAKFKQVSSDTTLFEISAGTVEMKNNKLILLAD